MPLPPPKNRTAHGTYLYFAEPDTLETFLRDYKRILIDKFQKIRIEGGGEYWSCGQEHDPRNWNWKPWQHLERLCRKRGLDDFAVRDILFEHLGRNLECECQVLYDERELRKTNHGSFFQIIDIVLIQQPSVPKVTINQVRLDRF